MTIAEPINEAGFVAKNEVASIRKVYFSICFYDHLNIMNSTVEVRPIVSR